MNLDIISEISEKQTLQYFCLLSNNHRYDLAVAYSENFFGKAMVTSIQTGKMTLLCKEDTDLDDHWAERLGIEQEDIPDFQEFLGMILQPNYSPEQF